MRLVIGGQVFLLKVKMTESFGESVFNVKIQPAPGLNRWPAPPKFTEKQGEYLAFIHHYTKIHRRGPAEADIKEYFHVTRASVNRMIQSLQSEQLIETTPAEARSIRLLVAPEYLIEIEATAIV